MILTPILTVGAYAGLFTGAGPYGGLTAVCRTTRWQSQGWRRPIR